MEVDGGLGRPVVERKRDEAAERVQKLFQDFLEEFTITENGEKIAKYKGTNSFGFTLPFLFPDLEEFQYYGEV